MVSIPSAVFSSVVNGGSPSSEFAYSNSSKSFYYGVPYLIGVPTHRLQIGIPTHNLELLVYLCIIQFGILFTHIYDSVYLSLTLSLVS